MTIVRPALIVGDQDEFRPTELVATRILRLVEPLLPRRYRIVPHEHVGRVLLGAAVTAPRGEHIIESDAITGEAG